MWRMRMRQSMPHFFAAGARRAPLRFASPDEKWRRRIVLEERMTANVLRITEHPPLRRDQAFDRLRDAIIKGHFKPGDRLIERDLCEKMGVSRTSIREVLRRLEAERLIEVEPRRGPIVARVTRKQIAEIYEVRALLEAALVRRFAEKATDEDIAALRRIYEELSVVRRSEDVPRIVELTGRFTEHMMQVVDHELINDIHQKLTARISLLRVLAISLPGRLEESARELAVVMEAIERRDGDLAAQSLTTYVLNAADAALKRLDAMESGAVREE
jgi:DNA-binding GntR family transcriptional regulator